METNSNFPLTGKYFPLTNFSNDKQTHESFENDFPESEFRETSITEVIFLNFLIIKLLKISVDITIKLSGFY
jgi:hypothetical protein